ncbi:MAG: glutathione S-transferase family protein [Roseitalea porphyridii]
MIVVHHLNRSRSQRITWLLEELEVPYRVRAHKRDEQTNLAPPELMEIHPLGKSPVIEDDGRVIFESGAIIDYLIRHYGNGKLQPAVNSPEYDDYQMWLHYAEGSAALPMLLNLYVSRLGEAGAPLHPRIESEIANHLGFIDKRLEGRDFLVGDDLTGADINLSFIVEIAGLFGKRAPFKNVERWIAALRARPAFHRAAEKSDSIVPL